MKVRGTGGGRIRGIDGLQVTGNRQPLSTGSLAAVSDCTSVVAD